MAFRVNDKYAFPELKEGDQDYRWCHKYAHDVVTGKIKAGKWIRLACERHLSDLNRDDIYFDVEAAKSVTLWFKFIPITDGKEVGKPTVLLPWQIFIVCCLVSWKITGTGLRKYKYAYVQVGRKNGKSTLAGGLTLYFMYKSGYFKPRAYSVATKKDQAKELWSAAHTMIKLSRRLQTIFEARTHDILMPSKEGHFVPLASDSNTLDGKNPLVANLDECHAIKDRNLYGVMVSAFGAQPEGLMLTITTAGTVLDGICTDLNKAGKKVLSLESEVKQDAYFYAIYEVDKGDKWDDPSVWIKANPGIGHQPRIDYMHDRCIEATLSSEEKINFLTKHLNLFVSGYDKWLEMDEVKACRFEKVVSDYGGQNCFGGIDRSRVHDLTSLCLLFPNDLYGCDCFYIHLLPRKTMEGATDHLKQIYRKAVETGVLILVDSPTIRDDQVKNVIEWAFNNFNVEMMGYDPWHMREIAEDLIEKYDYNLVSVSQGTGNMSEPAKKLEGLIKETIFRYNDLLFEFACTCAMAKFTEQNNVKIVRENDKTDKIDPLVATIIALSCATLQEPIDENPYETRELITL
jgi:phage terminase large subunit-like protein